MCSPGRGFLGMQGQGGKECGLSTRDVKSRKATGVLKRRSFNWDREQQNGASSLLPSLAVLTPRALASERARVLCVRAPLPRRRAARESHSSETTAKNRSP
eukprot:897932-Pleurochrysis_carterae.AAC.3